MATQELIGTVVNGHKVAGAVYNSQVGGSLNTSKVTTHSSLTGRDQPNQHPISAITGLEEALENTVAPDELAPVAFSGDAEDLTWPNPFILYCGTASEVV